MNPNEQPEYPLWDDLSNTNWVENRGQCSTTLGFWSLAKVVERDVQQANALPEQLRGQHTFSFERNEKSAVEPFFRVIKRHQNFPSTMEGPCVVFVQKLTHIEITCQGHPVHGSTPIRVTPSWDAKRHQCHWWIDKTHYDLWQVSQEVLGDLFFTQ